MKISKLFHWLYASVMMLPLVVAPIFAIYMHRHPVTNYEVETGGYEITEKFTTNDVSSFSDLVEGNIYHIDSLSVSSASVLGFELEFELYIYSYDSFTINADDYYTDEIYTYDPYDSNNNNYFYFGVSCDTESLGALTNYTNGSSYVAVDYENITNFVFTNLDFAFGGEDFLVFITDCLELSPSVITASTFNSYDYQYNEGLTYNDTDIGSQFVYALYLPINKYFNVTNFLGLNNLYSWINTNVFNGVAPLGFSLFYMLLSYWLLISIFWLVFDVVMYVPNLAHRWLDKGSLQ